MQASLAVAGPLLALAAWLTGAGLVWLLAGLLLGSVVPFTLIVMWPTSKQLEDILVSIRPTSSLEACWSAGVACTLSVPRSAWWR
jgi:hypothetical protein